ncbi:hypothetical protein QL285_001800 [Trifolium repens]|nr:hypothetical protein QL285_001800 [Trifolium repens]
MLLLDSFPLEYSKERLSETFDPTVSIGFVVVRGDSMALFLFWWFYFNGSVSVVICVTVVVESGVDYSDFFRQWWSAVRGCVNGCYASAALMLEAGVVLVAR